MKNTPSPSMAKGGQQKTPLSSKKLAKPLLSGKAGPPIAPRSAPTKFYEFLGIFCERFRVFSEILGIFRHFWEIFA